MNDPMAKVGIKLPDGWTAKEVSGGVLFTGHKTVLVGAKPQQRWEWAALLRHHRIHFEYVALPAPVRDATAGVCA